MITMSLAVRSCSGSRLAVTSVVTEANLAWRDGEDDECYYYCIGSGCSTLYAGLDAEDVALCSEWSVCSKRKMALVRSISAQSDLLLANWKGWWWGRYLLKAICYWQIGKDGDDVDICSKRSVTGKLEKKMMRLIYAQRNLLLTNCKGCRWGRYLPRMIW